MNRVECQICLETPILPVYFTCFPCDTASGPTCSSISRVCLACARRYLELDIPRKDRTIERRCLLCRRTVNPQTLSAASAYRKDYMLMSLDRERRQCIHAGCAFTGTHLELDHHVRTECSLRMVSCPGCRSAMCVRSLDQHRSTCTGHVPCTFCTAPILRQDIVDHMQHEHHRGRCDMCMTWIHENMMETHKLQECMYRFVPCTFCNTFVMHCDLSIHYSLKLDFINCEIAQLERRVQEMQASIQTLTATRSQVEQAMNQNVVG